MKQWLVGLVVFLSAVLAGAQVAVEPVTVQNSAPVGACTTAPLVKVSDVGTYQCINGTWTKVGPSDATGLPPTGPAGGGLSGTYPNPAVAVVPFSATTSGTNVGHGLVMGSGAVLTTSSGGFINANEINGVVLPISAATLGTNSSGQIVAGTAPLSTLSAVGTVPSTNALALTLTITGVTANSHCVFAPASATAATHVSGAFFGAATANTVTLTLGPASATTDLYEVICANNI